MTGLKVHRLRFGDWEISPVKSIAVEKFSLNKIAVGREDGDIEILDASNDFEVEARIVGSADFKLQSLCWSLNNEEQGRLFGISLKGFVFEVDIRGGNVFNITDAYGAAWCMAASPRQPLLAVGGEDGVIRLFQYDDLNRLFYFKSFPSSGTRVLSIAYHPTQPRLFMGCSDGTIRCFDDTSGRSLFRMTGDVTYGVFTPSIWSLTVLSDSTIVSGDSNGQIQIWDGHLGVLTSSFMNHLADVLTVTVTPDEDTIFASGIDGKVISLQRTREQLHIGSGMEGQEGVVIDQSKNTLTVKEELFGQWIYSHAQRIHTHDVLALAICNTAPASSTHAQHKLISGGLDAKLCYYDCKAFHIQRPHFLPTVPTTGLVSPSKDYSYLAIQNRRSVDLWHVDYPTIPSSSSNGNGNGAGNDSPKSVLGNHDEQCALALQLQLSDEDAKLSFLDRLQLSASGRLLLLTTSTSTRFYLLSSASSSTTTPSSSSSASTHRVVAKRVSNAPLLLQGKDHHITAFTIHTLSPATTGREESLAIFYKGSKQVFYIYRISYPVKDEQEDIANTDKPEVIFELIHTIPYEPPKSSLSSANLLTKQLSYVVKDIVMSDNQRYFTIVNANHAITTYALSKENVSVHAVLNHENNVSISKVQYLTTPSTPSVPTPVEAPKEEIAANGKKSKQKKDKNATAAVVVPATTTPSNVYLAILGCNNTFFVYDLQTLSVHSWSKTVARDLHMQGVPHTLSHHLVGMTAVPVSNNADNKDSSSLDYKFMLYNLMQCVYVHLGLPYPQTRTPPIIQPSYLTSSTTSSDNVRFAGEDASSNGKKRKQSDEEVEGTGNGAAVSLTTTTESTNGNKNLTLINKYRNVIHVGFVNENNLVVVENPWANISQHLPDVMLRKKFAT